MMTDVKKQALFVELRATGKSYSEICTELKVSKTTLVEWSKKHRLEIDNLRAIEREAIQRRLQLDEEAKMEMFGAMLGRLKAEFARRDLSTVSTEKLVDQITKISALVAEHQRKLTFVADYGGFDPFPISEWSA